MVKKLVQNRYKLLDPRDIGEFGNYYPGYPRSWGIYYKKVYAYICEQKGGYGMQVWIGNRTDYTNAILDLDGVLNVLDRYLPKKKEEQMALF